MPNLARDVKHPDRVKELPEHQLQEAVADTVDAQKQAIANDGTAKFKSCRQPSQVIKFKAGNYKKNHWCPSIVKGLTTAHQKTFPLNIVMVLNWFLNLEYGMIFFQSINNHYPLHNQKLSLSTRLVRTFLTGYDGKKLWNLGMEI
ncbi:MAG: hypothetical protein MGG11_08550 [Trichodesmium sp. MAG_R03]|nr:hypothetical protein [Trichodesmium sp. MAG_R03]